MKISTIKSKLIDCGYRPDWLRHDYRFSDYQTVKPLVGFAHLPFDARSSCIAVLESEGDPRREVEQCRATGAPLVFVCTDNSLLWWTQGVNNAQFKESIREDRVEQFFKERRDDFSPNAIYRAKTWGRFRSEFQLSFVDAGLMPLVEEEVGTSLERLIERNVTTTKSRLGWDAISEQQGHWDMRIPDLEEVWSELSRCQRVSDRCDIGLGLFYHSKLLSKGLQTYSSEKFEGATRGFYRFEPSEILLTDIPTLYWMSLRKEAIQRTRAGTTTGVSQVVMNYARVSRGPWRIKALSDSVGRPISSNFLVARSKELPIKTLWAIFNSPIANAYAFCHLGKRHNIVSRMREMPLPSGRDFSDIDKATEHYFEAARCGDSPEIMQQLLSEVDAVVLRQYDLPIDLEYKLLSLFDGWERLGVPFKQSVLLPKSLGGKVRFSDFVRYEKDWRRTNRRRGELIDKKIDETITDDERTELNGLQAYAEYYLDRETPLPMGELENAESSLLSSATGKGEEH